MTKRMTQPTIAKRARHKFNMPLVRRRAKKMMRKKFKKTIKLSDVDKVWNDYVELGIIQPLIKYGFVNVDDRMSFKIVGKSVVNRPEIAGMFERGVSVRKGGLVTDTTNITLNRSGIIYKIVLTDTNCKNGELIFKPHKEFAKKVHYHIKNNNPYYPIEK